jgi:hypothetical protein
MGIPPLLCDSRAHKGITIVQKLSLRDVGCDFPVSILLITNLNFDWKSIAP